MSAPIPTRVAGCIAPAPSVGNRGEAERELDTFVASVTDRSVAGMATTVGELLARWFELVSTSWSPATVHFEAIALCPATRIQMRAAAAAADIPASRLLVPDDGETITIDRSTATLSA